jgi:hypothetical protein
MRKLFAAFLVSVILLGGDLIWRAWAQTNTFCAANLPCTPTALWNFTGGLQSNGASVLTNPVNLATQVTGTLAGANYAAVNLAAGNVNGGATGVLPGANMAATNLAGGNNPGGVSGTLPGSSMAVFVASGASHAPGAVPDPGSSAGTTHFLREDATWATIPASGAATAYLTSNYTNATSTLTNVTGLSFAVAANKNYSVSCNLDFSSGTTTEAIAFAWTGPASPTAVTYDVIQIATQSSAGISGAVATAFGTTLSQPPPASAGVNFPLRLSLTLLNGANAGTIQLQASAPQGTATVTIIPGSCMMNN